MFFNVANITENLHCRLFYQNVSLQLHDFLQKDLVFKYVYLNLQSFSYKKPQSKKKKISYIILHYSFKHKLFYYGRKMKT